MLSDNSPFLFAPVHIPDARRRLATAALCTVLCLIASSFPRFAQAQAPQTGQGTPPLKPTAAAPTLAPLPEVEALLDRAKALMVARKYEESEKTYRQAWMIAQAHADGVGESEALLSLGYFFDSTNRADEALTTYQKGLPVARAADCKRNEAFLLTGLGDVYEEIGRPSEALTNYHQALSIYRFMGNKRGEVNSLNSIGKVCRDTGRLSEALRIYQQALSIYRATEDKSSEADTSFGTGTADDNADRSSEALPNFRKTLSIAYIIGGARVEARALIDIGTVYEETGRPIEALRNFQQARTLYHAVHAKVGEADALNNIGLVYEKTGRSSEALIANQQALMLYRAGRNNRGEAHALNNIGGVYRDTNRPFEALMTYQQALALHRAIGEKGGEADDLHNKADMERKFDEREAAKTDYTESIALIEQIRTDLGGYTRAKQAYAASFRSTYSDYLDFLLTTPKSVAVSSADTGAAFVLTQQTKGRALLDLLGSGQVDLTGSLTSDEKAQLWTLRQESDALNVRLVKEGVENEVGAKARFADLQRQQQENEGKLQRLTETLYAQHSDLAVKRAAKTATAADLAPLLDADTALLEFVQTADDKIALFAVTRGDGNDLPKVITQYLTVPASLAADCAAFQAACADPRKDYKPLAASLYQTLIAPVASAITGKKRLIVCPDGPLWNVPFQALMEKSDVQSGVQSGKIESFLADRFEIDYAYSATGALAAHNERQRQQQAQQAQLVSSVGKDSLLVVANPAFGDAKRFGDLDDLPGQRPIDKPSRPIDSPSRPLDKPSRAMAATLERAGGRIAELPGTQQEADALQTLFPGATLLTGNAAQEGAVKQDLTQGHFRYLHFATHGFINDGAPMLSSLVLAQPDMASKAAGDDGFLTARELFDLHLPQTEMVTLSACNTGRGDIQSGEGIVGMTWALFAAGCPTEVVSQWSVDDACTATLMERFYAGLKAGKPKGEALHDAAQATANDSSAAHRHPYYWAPFVLFGEWK